MVNQMMSSKDASPLLDTAISKLRPGLFSHPVWIRFGSKEKPVPPKTINALIFEAEKLKQQNPSDACQVLLACAVFQHYSGQTENALTTIQEVQDFAKKTELDHEILWALWGACAICIQNKRFSKAADYLTSLKHMLSDQDDWVLAEFVDIIKQTLVQGEKANNILPTDYREDQPMGNVLVNTFDWLNQWGFSAQAQQLDTQTSKMHDRSKNRLFPRFPLNGLSSLSLLFKGELKVKWLENSSQRGKWRSTFWGYILSLLRIEVTSQEQEDELEIINSEIVPAETATVQLPNEVNPVAIQDSEPIQEDPLSISVQMLGSFNLTVQETVLDLPSSRSLSLLKYLLLNHKQNTPREMLLEFFWPDVSFEKGRNNLNVAMNGIRTALRTVTDAPVILYKDNAYGIAPEVQFWVDVEEFERLVDSGRRLESRNRLSSAISDYEVAVSLYQGDLLEENPYENWTVLPRERLRLAYLVTLDSLSRIYFSQERYALCITFSQLILSRDRCREDAHSMLMRCYSRQGQDHLALRQYQACVEALRMELDVTPAPETTKLYELIRQHRQV